MLHVIASITVAPGKRSEFMQAFRRLVPQVRQEDGCLEYGPAIEVPCAATGVSQIDPDQLTVIEKWRDLAALEKHLSAPLLSQFRQEVQPLTRNVAIRVLEPQ